MVPALSQVIDHHDRPGKTSVSKKRVGCDGFTKFQTKRLLSFKDASRIASLTVAEYFRMSRITVELISWPRLRTVDMVLVSWNRHQFNSIHFKNKGYVGTYNCTRHINAEMPLSGRIFLMARRECAFVIWDKSVQTAMKTDESVHEHEITSL